MNILKAFYRLIIECLKWIRIYAKEISIYAKGDNKKPAVFTKEEIQEILNNNNKPKF